MGQYRFSIYAHLQLGFMFKADDLSIEIGLPFMSMHFALSKYAKGVCIFNLYSN